MSAIAAHNFNQLNTDNIECHLEDGFLFLENSSKTFDWIFVDPSRRNDSKGKVFLLSDCEPNIPNALPGLFQYSKNILVKVSPLLDISQAIQELQYVKAIHVVAVNNEVKELLFILELHFQGEIKFHAINLVSGRKDVFTCTRSEEKELSSNLGLPNTYLYEPDAAILKSGAFKSVGLRYGLKKLHAHSHLYTSDKLIEFPGRRFLIQSCLPYTKKTMKSFKATKANITTRNFPTAVAQLRKKHQILDGGNSYIFFTKIMDDSKQVLVCEKILDSN